MSDRYAELSERCLLWVLSLWWDGDAGSRKELRFEWDEEKCKVAFWKVPRLFIDRKCSHGIDVEIYTQASFSNGTRISANLRLDIRFLPIDVFLQLQQIDGELYVVLQIFLSVQRELG